MQRLTLYKSSAGSGKTFTLVLEYLKLVLPAPHRYRYILAVTFTNKATEEMKNRIIHALADLANATDEELPKLPYFALLESHFSDTPHADLEWQQQARKVLNFILNDYTNFSVSTIERFFQRIVRAFARELNVPIGYDVEMNQPEVLTQLIDELMIQTGDDPRLTRLLKGFVARNLEAERSWNVETQVYQLGMEIFKERYQAQKAWQKFEGDRVDTALELESEVWKIRGEFERKMREMAEAAIDLLDRYNLKPYDLSYGKSGVGNYFLRVLDQNDFDPGKRSRDVLGNPQKWYAKKTPADVKGRIEGALDAGLMGLCADMVSLYDSEFKTYNTALQVSRTVFSLGLLGDLQDKLSDYRRTHNTLLISDTSSLLGLVIGEGPLYDTPFVYEKVGTRFQYYLLDEFQDTSNLQWDNLRPLVLESLAQGAGSLIVGDAKQSIYRWRNGNMRLLMYEVEEGIKEFNHQPEVEELVNNWRTASEIVHFNNQLFEAASLMLGAKFEGEDQRLFAKAYHKVAQKPRKTDISGHLELVFLKKEDKKDPDEPGWREKALARTLTLIQQLKEEGFRGEDITLLVRKNSDGIDIATYLQQHGVKVISAESLLIASHPVVGLLHALLQYLHQEADMLTQATLGYFYAQLVEEDRDLHRHFRQRLSDDFLERLTHHVPHLRQLPLYECLEQLLALLPEKLSTPNAYVQGFLDAALAYSLSEDTSIAGFLAWWEKERNKKGIAAAPDPEAVQVMTIHKSKGLEFPVVIMPFTEWGLYPNDDGFIWVEPQGKPYDLFPTLPVHPSRKLLESDFNKPYETEVVETHLDGLNMLYVAFTRPKYRLYAFTEYRPFPKNSSNPPPTTISQLLTGLWELGKLGNSPTEGTEGVYIGPQNQPVNQHMEAVGNESVERHPLRPNSDTLSNWQQSIRIKYHADRVIDRVAQAGKIEIGKLLHTALDYIQQAGDIDYAIQRLTLQGMIPQGNVEDLRKQLKEALAFPAARHWYDGSWQVRNEAEIILADGNLMRPDRVMIQGQKAVVVDYKSGKPYASHAGQVKQYMTALWSMGYQQVEGYLYYLSPLKVMPVE